MGFQVADLYEIDAKAAAAGYGVTRHTDRLFQSVAAITVTNRLKPVPMDRVRIITGFAYSVIAGAAQTLLGPALGPPIVIRIPSGTGTDQVYSETDYAGVGLATWGNRFHCELVLMPMESLEFQATFSAGLNANSLTVNAIGYEIPRGNFQY